MSLIVIFTTLTEFICFSNRGKNNACENVANKQIDLYEMPRTSMFFFFWLFKSEICPKLCLCCRSDNLI